MAFAGLATAAGAGDGLETLLARMRADEVLKNQGRSIDIDQFNANSADRSRTGQLDVQRGELAEKANEFSANAPVRAADVANANATAAHTGAETTGLEDKNNIIKGLMPSLGANNGQAGAEVGNPLNPGATTGGSTGVASMDNPAGRLRLSVAGITPSSVFHDDTEAEKNDTAYASSIGKRPDQLTFADRVAMQKALPNYGLATTRIALSTDANNRANSESTLRQREMNLRIKEGEQKLKDLPPLQRSLALAEFQNRIKNDVQSKQTWSQWLNGEPVADPGSQIDAIMADVVAKHGGAVASPATGGDDLDAILAARRVAGGSGPKP